MNRKVNRIKENRTLLDIILYVIGGRGIFLRVQWKMKGEERKKEINDD